MYVVFCKIDHCIHIHWCIVMGLGYNDPWVESHMWPQQTWGQRSSRGQWPLVQVFGKKGQCIHILWCIFKSNITMIAKVCDRESRGDTWFEYRLVWNKLSKLHIKDPILHVTTTFSLKQGETRTNIVPIPHPLMCFAHLGQKWLLTFFVRYMPVWRDLFFCFYFVSILFATKLTFTNSFKTRSWYS